jgi:hypothetical protein
MSDMMEDHLIRLKTKGTSEEIDKIISDANRAKSILEQVQEEEKWFKGVRHYLIPPINTNISEELDSVDNHIVQLSTGDAYTVFYSEINGERRYYYLMRTGLQGFQQTTEIEKYDAERFADYLITGKTPPQPPKIEIVEKVEIISKRVLDLGEEKK